MFQSGNAETRVRAAAIINAGGVIAFRTDTFYGLGANPCDPQAVRAVARLKGREDDKPILVLLSDESQVGRFVERRNELFALLSAQHWPGALTLVAEARTGLPSELTAGGGTIGVRVPADQAVRALLHDCGGALTATSANRTGEPPARTTAEVWQAFGNQVDLIIDGGTAHTARPSTVVEVTGGEARLIREGEIAWEQLQATLKR